MLVLVTLTIKILKNYEKAYNYLQSAKPIQIWYHYPDPIIEFSQPTEDIVLLIEKTYQEYSKEREQQGLIFNENYERFVKARQLKRIEDYL